MEKRLRELERRLAEAERDWQEMDMRLRRLEARFDDLIRQMTGGTFPEESESMSGE